MTRRQPPCISTRKQPQQARSTELVAAILEAAVQVLAKEGATRFTTARVAEKAGVSVGSVYQYFPNKAAILFRLQSDEWQQTTRMLRNILEKHDEAPLDRLRTLVHAFIQSECEEAQMRGALSDAAPLYRDAPEALEVRAAGRETFEAFMLELLPEVAENTRTLACDLMLTTLSSVGKEFSCSPRTTEKIAVYAEGMADMFRAYVKALNPP
ncbi:MULTISPECIES: TetR family transcriptional regulator [unclassified Pseudomonas]|uniref:TetR family transcriptional regulator n=1 Tax=unclassified Pseudomonas TaxID=196821 RepID=UPI0008EFE08C|nr:MULTISPECIES: TetR family transcriptional regulator [unclassified Pseudomonas]PMV17767.1 TetR/AcrR family transcriptional regulator [Pseudomonas sp. FW305-3-2-15-C-TSA2]PMV19153.1 TetR/AcrR family transcriptional regulator [Pseudomonas sp. DP16D-L5]PMV37887.1 TetR/AcrR family transcriptional regulator [Pseudomonas sp. FW305-3-2-15-A-LB2]PMV42881.1 TetR/AcrR family transcriptional regulator [Pseudomonas sp. FW305-3-2-15-C-LB1]PMV44290.1 TetR/AcrR family transcriptional regulator [Pseudomonas